MSSPQRTNIRHYRSPQGCTLVRIDSRLMKVDRVMPLCLRPSRRRVAVLRPSWTARSHPFAIWGLFLWPFIFLVGSWTVGWEAIGFATMGGLVCLFAWWTSDVVIVERDNLLVGRASDATYVPGGETTKASVKAFRSSFPTRGRHRLIARDGVVGFAARLNAGQLAIGVLIRDQGSMGPSDGRPMVLLPIAPWQNTRPPGLVAADVANLNAAWGIDNPPDNDGALIRPEPLLLAGREVRDLGWIVIRPEGLSGSMPDADAWSGADAESYVVPWDNIDVIQDGNHSESIAQAGSYDVWDLRAVLMNGDTVVYRPAPGAVSRDDLVFVVSAAAAHGVSSHVTGLLPTGSRHTPIW
jgi:hypothetical protein